LSAVLRSAGLMTNGFGLMVHLKAATPRRTSAGREPMPDLQI
jgi:hypothetical protein